VSMSYVRKTYGVPAKRGARILFGRPGHERGGVITGASHYVFVRFDGDKHSVPVHPTDDWLEYLPEGSQAP